MCANDTKDVCTEGRPTKANMHVVSFLAWWSRRSELHNGFVFACSVALHDGFVFACSVALHNGFAIACSVARWIASLKNKSSYFKFKNKIIHHENNNKRNHIA